MDVITHPEVDAVWICSPSQYHADQVRYSFGAARLFEMFFFEVFVPNSVVKGVRARFFFSRSRSVFFVKVEHVEHV